MIGSLPTTLNIDGREFEINSDFRFSLACLQAFNDEELTEQQKIEVMLRNIYKEIPENLQAAVDKAIWFLDCGKQQTPKEDQPRLMDWGQDEQFVFSSINRKCGYSVRATDYMHWWDFIGYYMEPDESLFSQIVAIRAKRKKGIKLEKWEQQFYRENQAMIDLEKDTEEFDATLKALRGE